MIKKQKIKSKYQKYANIIFVIIAIVICYLLYVLYLNRSFAGLSDYKQTKGSGDFGKAFTGKFQPGDEKAHIPGKLRWGKDF